MTRATGKSSFGSLHHAAYKRFVKLLVDERLARDLKQQAIADQLGWNQSVIAKIEAAQRRVDFVEVILIAEALGYDAALLVAKTRLILLEEGALP